MNQVCDRKEIISIGGLKEGTGKKVPVTEFQTVMEKNVFQR